MPSSFTPLVILNFGCQHTSLLHGIDATTFEQEDIIRIPAIIAERPRSTSPRPSAPATTGSAPSSPLPTPVLAPARHPPLYVRSLTSSLQHVPSSRLHIHPQGHGHYHHYHALAAPQPTTQTSNEREREPRLRVRVRRRDFLLSTAAALPTPTPASESTTPLLARRRSHAEVGHSAGAGTEMDVDGETDDVDDAEEEAEADCLTSRAPSRAASPPPSHGRQSRRPAAPYAPAPDHTTADSSGGGALAIQTPAHLDFAGTCFDPRGAWLYVASTAGIVEWRVRGGEKRWWSEPVWA